MVKNKKQILFLVAYYIFLFIVFLGCAEIIYRVRGRLPWRIQEIPIQVEPGGKLFMRDARLGYRNLPGQFRVTFDNAWTTTATHLKDGRRITRPAAKEVGKNIKDEIWIFGCSFTYGYVVSDDETYPWYLQEKLSQFDISNFGVNGYNNVQSFLQLQEGLQAGKKPKLVILAYAPFQDMRNTATRYWRKSMVPYNRLGQIGYPFARLDAKGRLRLHENVLAYREFPFMRHSAFIHSLECWFNKFEDRLVRSHEVSKSLIKEFDGFCRARGIRFVLAMIADEPGSQDILDFCKREGIEAVDISADLDKKENKDAHFGHPNANANRQYARGLEQYLLKKRP